MTWAERGPGGGSMSCAVTGTAATIVTSATMMGGDSHESIALQDYDPLPLPISTCTLQVVKT